MNACRGSEQNPRTTAIKKEAVCGTDPGPTRGPTGYPVSIKKDRMWDASPEGWQRIKPPNKPLRLHENRKHSKGLTRKKPLIIASLCSVKVKATVVKDDQ